MNYQDEILSQIRANALNRIRPEDERVGAHYRQAVVSIAGVGDILSGVRAKHTQDKNLSPSGRAAKIAEFVQGDGLRRFATVTKDVRKALKHTEAKLKSFAPAKVDPADAAAATLRQDMRMMIRSLPNGERYKAAADPDFAAAILEAPPALSGLDANFYGHVREAHIKALHGPEIEKIEEFRQMAEEANAVVSYVRNMMFEASGLTREGFEAAMQPIEAEADAG